MNVVCAIAKNENKYIRDWVQYYLSIGFDHIYIYDNNELTAPDIRTLLADIKNVTIFDVRGQQYAGIQTDCYTKFYQEYKNKFDWCLFCDIDEFLTGVKDVRSWLQHFKADQIRIQWKLFGDDDIIERDTSIPVYKFFKHQVKSSLHRNLQQKGDLEIQGKAIVRGGMDDVYLSSPHYALRKNHDIKSVLPSGKPATARVRIRQNYSKETVFLNHYMTKTLSEFAAQKLNRHDAVYGSNISLDYFWRINKKTPEKLQWLKDHGYIK